MHITQKILFLQRSLISMVYIPTQHQGCYEESAAQITSSNSASSFSPSFCLKHWCSHAHRGEVLQTVCSQNDGLLKISCCKSNSHSINFPFINYSAVWCFFSLKQTQLSWSLPCVSWGPQAQIHAQIFYTPHLLPPSLLFQPPALWLRPRQSYASHSGYHTQQCLTKTLACTGRLQPQWLKHAAVRRQAGCNLHELLIQGNTQGLGQRD